MVTFWGVIRALFQTYVLPPACSSPFIIEDLSGSWQGRYMRMAAPNNTVFTVPHSVRLQVCYGLLPARPGYMASWVESLCMLVSEINHPPLKMKSTKYKTCPKMPSDSSLHWDILYSYCYWYSAAAAQRVSSVDVQYSFCFVTLGKKWDPLKVKMKYILAYCSTTI